MIVDETRIAVLGSTGSIGAQTLDVVSRLRILGHGLRIVALAAGANDRLLGEQIAFVRPDAVSLADASAAARVRTAFPNLHVLAGPDASSTLCLTCDADLVVNAIVGVAGLPATLAALARGRTVALANKESLVAGGELVRMALASGRGTLVPVDSEHSAILQCLGAGRRDDVRRLVLTASGGPFLGASPAVRAAATARDALRHPTWTMGRRVSIDSATLVNKAFEVIEAHYLFDVPYDRISVVIHPESVVHSFVEFRDGAFIAQAAARDMRIPIQYAITRPARADTGLPDLEIERLGDLRFRPLDAREFPAFATVLDAARAGGTAPAAVNAADEVLVERFLRSEIGFDRIAEGLDLVLSSWRRDVRDGDETLSLSKVRDADQWARAVARNVAA